MSAFAEEMASPLHYAKELGKRFSEFGIDTYASENERYLVLLQDAPGEVIDLGRPLRGSRIFGHEAIRKNIPVVAEFVAFSQEKGLENCMFWGVGLTGSKATPDDLANAMKAFNSKINIEFTELRKRHCFELLLIAIHPRYDHETGLFDLHAHLICRVPPERREAVQRRLMSKFSKVDLNTKPVRNPAAVATYMLWGIWRNKVMLTWPDHALKAAWSLTQHRFRLFRTGGQFAKWRASTPSSPERTAKLVDKATVDKNRRETNDERERVQTGDRLLSKVLVRYGGHKVAALLFEVCAVRASQEVTINPDVVGVYSSATIVVTQEATLAKEDAMEERHTESSGLSQEAPARPTKHLKGRLSAISSKAAEAVRLVGTRIKSATAFVSQAISALFCSQRRNAESVPNQTGRSEHDHNHRRKPVGVITSSAALAKLGIPRRR